jgi:hypothetical protein
MKRSFARLTTLLCLIAIATLFLGCGPSWPFQWKATEAIRQCQALAQDDINAAKRHTNALGREYLNEASAAANVVGNYVGVPKQRHEPLRTLSREALAKAERDATRPPPTPQDVAQAVPGEIEESVMPWVDFAIAALGIFAPAAAGTALVFRKKFKDVVVAFEQTVEGVDNARLPSAAKKTLRTELAKAQDNKTKQAVTRVKAKVRR